MALLWQVGCEFIAAARQLEPFGFSLRDAWDALADMQAMADVVLLPSAEIWASARTLQERLELHFWDALIVAACLQGGVKTLYSEDFGDRSSIDQLRIMNPFGKRQIALFAAIHRAGPPERPLASPSSSSVLASPTPS